MESNDKTAPRAVNSKIERTLSDPLPAMQVAFLATTATSVSEDKSASRLSKWWDIESYASNCNVNGHSKDEQRAIKTFEQSTRFTGGPRWRENDNCGAKMTTYEIGQLWHENEIQLTNNFNSAMAN